MSTIVNDAITIPEAPDIPGLTFRHFRGESDYPQLLLVSEASKRADGIEDASSLEAIARNYANLKNCDPYQDMIMAEVNGNLVGYNRTEWWVEDSGSHIYWHFGFVLPEWRGKGIGGALTRQVERRLREIAASHPKEQPAYFSAQALNTQTGLKGLLETEGYGPVRYSYEMIRPNLDNIPDLPLPEGIEVRPALPEHYRAIWDAEVEAFKDHWGATQHDESDFVRWQEDSTWHKFQPHLWQVAWDGDQVVGRVGNYINEFENTKFNRKRGYTEDISVRRPWRKRGIARALIARSFQVHKDQGMEEAALGVDAQNPNGALQLYESMGFQVAKNDTAYRKAL